MADGGLSKAARTQESSQPSHRHGVCGGIFTLRPLHPGILASPDHLPSGVILVDAYNVLHTQGVLPPRLAGIEVQGLVRLIQRSRFAGRRLTIVCDGTDSGGRSGMDALDGASVHYSGPHSEADAVIERLLESASAARTWTVISSDRRVQRAARRARADVLDSRTFLEQLVADESHKRKDGLPPFATEVPLDRYSVAHWLEEFGLDPSSVLQPRTAAGARLTPPHPIKARSPDPAANPLPQQIPSSVPQITDPFLIRAAQDPAARLVLGELDMSLWMPPSGTPIKDPGPRSSERSGTSKSKNSRDRKSKG